MGLELKIVFFVILNYTNFTFYKVASEFNFSALVFDSCPYNTFCTFGNNSVPSGNYSCCAECSCSDDCYITNNCCPDSNNADMPYKGSCKTQSEHFDYHRPYSAVDTGHGDSYAVIDTCDDDHNKDTVMRCLYPTALLDHVFVSDPGSRTIYKNRHCAACNGIQVYDEWKMTVACKADEALLSLENREEFILRYCSLVSVPPEHIKESFDTFICAPDAISKCNDSGDWDFYDHEMEQACKQYNMAFRDEKIVNGRLVFIRNFKNVFCFLCNKKRGVKVEAECLTKVGVVPNKAPILGMTPLTAVFNPREEDIIGSTCGRTEIEDPLLGTCKPLGCPFGETTYFGNCVEDMQFLSLYLSAAYQIEAAIPEKTADRDQILNEIADALMNEAKEKLQAASCGFCKTYIIDFTKLVIASHTTEKCSFAKMLQVFKFLSKALIRSIPPRFATYDLMIRQSHVFPMEFDALAPTYRVLYSRRCNEGLQLKPKFYCKRITYSLDELMTKGVANEMIDKLIQMSDPVDDVIEGAEQYVICINDYKVLVNDAPNSLGKALYVVSVSVMVQCIYNM